MTPPSRRASDGVSDTGKVSVNDLLRELRVMQAVSLEQNKTAIADRLALLADFNAKHEQNTRLRHDRDGWCDQIGNRLSLVERDVKSIYGDGTGDTGLLNKIARNQENQAAALTEVKAEQKSASDKLEHMQEETSEQLGEIAKTQEKLATTVGSLRDQQIKWAAAILVLLGIPGVAWTVIEIVKVLHR